MFQAVGPGHRRRGLDRAAPVPGRRVGPAHTHTRKDEYSIITEGQIGFRSGDRQVVLGPGGYITTLRRVAHDVERRPGADPDDRGDQPAGLENFFRELADLTAAGPPRFPDARPWLTGTGLQPGQPGQLPG